MGKFIIAGAGHGGLVVAAQLAKNGHEVTVLEKNSRDSLGHDFEDRFTFSLLEEITGIAVDSLTPKIWRERGDCAFVSPAKRKKVIIKYTPETRQKVMWRKPLIKLLTENAERCGARLRFGVEVTAPVTDGNRVTGVYTQDEMLSADCVIDACGVFSPLRCALPPALGIEAEPRYGDLFYAYRAYFTRDTSYAFPEIPFEVYLYHEGEQGLSWCCANGDEVDVLIGRVYELTDEKVQQQLALFRADHPWIGQTLTHGGTYGVIPVRRPLTLMVADGYAAVGDSAFMTTPMNGMGIDLSLQAGKLLAQVLLSCPNGEYTAKRLWQYNRDFHRLYGGDTAKNEGLKNALLTLPGEGVDFLFENDVIQSSDLAGAGKNTDLRALFGKFVRGMRAPGTFFALIRGLINGSAASKLYKSPPENFDMEAIRQWDAAIKKKDIPFQQKS